MFTGFVIYVFLQKLFCGKDTSEKAFPILHRPNEEKKMKRANDDFHRSIISPLPDKISGFNQSFDLNSLRSTFRGNLHKSSTIGRRWFFS